MAHAPSPFVRMWLPRLASELRSSRRALDLACGSGRHAPLLIAAGFTVFAVDADETKVRAARTAAADAGGRLRAWVADLTAFPLPFERFDLVLCTRYLQRELWPSLAGVIRPGGFLLYETFTTRQLRHGSGPRSPDHLLEPGELRSAVPSLEVRWYEEVHEPEAVARLAARKRSAGT